MTRLGLRGRLTLFVTLGALVGLVVLVVGFNLFLRDSLDSDADRLLEARASAALEGVIAESGQLRTTETPDDEAPDAQVWIYSGSLAIERAPGAPELQRLADSLAGGDRTFVDQEETDTRVLAVPIEAGGVSDGTVITAISTEPYEVTAHNALVGSVAFAVVLLIIIAIGTQVLVARALRPVAAMTEEARKWSETDLDHRFNAGKPNDELTRLAATFDSMLERLAAALRNERRFTAEISHELRTPLAAVIAESELALRRPRSTQEYRDALAGISRRAQQLQTTLDSLLLSATTRSDAGQRSNVSQAVAQAVAGLSELAEDEGVSVTFSGHTNAEVAANSQAVERAISPLIENACRYGAKSVNLTVEREGTEIAVVVMDDGEGIEDDEAEEIFEPGHRGKSGASRAVGAGLGLSLSRRLARAIGGDVVVRPADAGARFELRIPAA
jgi:signal transduction histidine kinase